MTGRYKAYPEYKDSGVEWLDVIPEHWKVNAVKRLTDFQVGWTPSTGKDSNFIGDNLWANISDLKGKFLNDTAKKISDLAAQTASMEITPKGSLLYSFKLSVGAVSFANKDMYTNEAIASFLSTSSLPLSYLYYALPIFVIENASTNIYGAKILNQELIKNATLIEPSYLEAEAIADFLDHETAKIDTLITKQEKLIELLKEKRQAVISHAVTKGLNPDAPMKDSGVEWLGEVPEHWAVAPIKHFISDRKGAVKVGPFGSHLKNTDMLGEDVKVIAQKNVISKDISVGEAFISWEKYEELQAFTIEKGDLLITTRGTLGRTFIYDTDVLGILHPCLIRLQCNESKIKPELLALIIERSGYAMEQILVSSNSTTIEVIYSESLMNTVITLPKTLSEQCELLNYLEEQDAKFSKIIANAERSIALMGERKTALISAAVTGKIDVRDWDAQGVQG
ncbi:TPA: hypothetical protein I7147_10355 [Vibrio vulnificus]|nr:hypothetical protein [Vibrio vulnificus]HAS6224376.1 hypothetical protein [Vibrio vulnificus]HDY7454154.1 restriction endonuclease subunit S [Vibrio vulnificus]